MPNLDEVPIERIRMQVLMRHPYSMHEGLLTVDAQQLVWQSVPFVDHSVCEHEATGCYICLETWYYDHNIRFTDSERPEFMIDFDQLRADELAKRGVVESLDATFTF